MTLQDWPFVAIHASVLPDGNVITFGLPLETHPLLWDNSPVALSGQR